MAYRLTINKAISQGWLVPIRQCFVSIDSLDFSSLKSHDGDFTDNDLDALIRDKGGEMVCKIAAGMAEASGTLKTLIFTPKVESAKLVAQALEAMGKKAVAIDGKWDKDKRRAALLAYRRDEFQFLVNCQLFTEGTDEPSIEVIGSARPTESRSLYTQMVGRGLRPLPGVVDFSGSDDHLRRSAIFGSKKPGCLVVDLVGNSGKHKLVCTADILGEEYEAKVLERAKKRLSKAGGGDAMELLEEEKAKLQEEREESHRRREARRATLVPVVKMTMVDVDPFGNDITPQGTVDDGFRPATTEQLDYIAKIAGIDAIGWSHSDAQGLIREHHFRKSRGLASIKQKRILEKQGVVGAADFSGKKASALIDLIAASGWQGLPIIGTDRLTIKPIGDTFQLLARMDDGSKVMVGKPAESVDAAREYGRLLVGEADWKT